MYNVYCYVMSMEGFILAKKGSLNTTFFAKERCDILNARKITYLNTLWP